MRKRADESMLDRRFFAEEKRILVLGSPGWKDSGYIFNGITTAITEAYRDVYSCGELFMLLKDDNFA